MRTPPADLCDAAVAAAVAAHWSIPRTRSATPRGVRQPPLAAHGTERALVRSADAVADSSARTAELDAALATAHALHHRCGLEFVVAPHLNADRALLSVSGRYALAVYPYLERSADAPADKGQLLSMISAVHAATSEVAGLVMVDDLTLPDRAALEAVLAGAGPDRSCGPFAAHFATLVRPHRWQLGPALDRHDVVAAALGAERSGWVATPWGSQTQ